jgi:CBS domain-containing protein
MGQHDVTPELDPAAIRAFTKSLLSDLRALEQILESDAIESGIRRFGAEQELILVDRAWRPAPIAIELLEELDDPRYTTELARFNLEINLDPVPIGGDAFAQVEAHLNELVGRVGDLAREREASVALTGILPTLSKSDLSLDNITPRARYYALNEATTRMRGGPYRLQIEGTDELRIEHESVMLEACNTSFQIHFQVDAADFPLYYNIAQAIAAPVLAAAVNSPLLFGKRLWRETRIALFQQSVDTRSATPHIRDLSSRVRFGEKWIARSVLEVFQEDVARFRVLMATQIDEDPFEVLASGSIPSLKALQLHNSTVYRWNRPCYGIAQGRPHLRIECRALPAGPSIPDEVANGAFWVGLMVGMAAEYGDITHLMDFDDAKANFLAAARHGLKTGFTWLKGGSPSAPELILGELLPLARHGLRSAGVRGADIDRYCGIIEARVASARTGARWLVESLAAMKDSGIRSERLAALTAAIVNRQKSGRPGHEWELATLDEAGDWRGNYLRVEQYMITDLFTVREDELVDFVAFLMDRKQIRHVMVEDNEHKLVGIVSYRSLIRLMARQGVSDYPMVPVREIMEPNPITIAPETPSTDAMELMHRKRVSALPVVKNGKLVGLVNEASFIEVARGLLASTLREH